MKENISNNFKRDIKIKEDKEKTRLLKLQKEFSEEKIAEENINEDDIRKLHCLYDEQIEELNKSTEIYRKRILEIRSKLNKA